MTMLKTVVALLAVAALVCTNGAAPSLLGLQIYLNQPCASASVINAAASWYCQNIYPAVTSNWAQWSPFAYVAILFSFMIATVIFIAGIVLRNEKVRIFGVGEFYEALATTIIVALFLFITSVFFGLIPGLFVPINPYNTSLTLMNNTIGTTGGLITNLFFAQNLPAYYSSFQLTVCGDVATLGYDACQTIPQIYAAPLMFLFVLPTTAVTLLLMDGLLILTSEFYMILFFMYAALPIFLIPGILFRSFLPTRTVGGMLIAMAIGFYMIMPLIFGIAFELNSGGTNTCLNQVSNNVVQQSQGGNSQSNAVSPTSPLVSDLSQLQGGCMSQFWLMIIFYPALILGVTYASILTIAEFIGGMSSSSGRLRALI